MADEGDSQEVEFEDEDEGDSSVFFEDTFNYEEWFEGKI